jgi:multicomponent Na+:H+ antiporter subunit D
MDYHPYDTRHVVTQLQLLVFGALGFVTLVKSGVYPDEKRAVHIDAEWLYRKLGPAFVTAVGSTVSRMDRYVRAAVLEFVRSTLGLAGHWHGPVGPLARWWPTGSMVLWVAILLGAYLIFNL